MSRLANLKAELKQRMKHPSDRPFVCDGSPFHCAIFIVGLNPATKMKEDFWSFWRGDGFERGEWDVAYHRARRRLGNTKQSRTRERLKEIAGEFSEHGWLETNLYWTPTKSERDLSTLKRKLGLTKNNFYFLLEQIRPKVVVGHGRHLRKECDALERMGIPFVLAEKHLSRISNRSMEELIRKIGKALER